jgi:hypothetical protein
MQCHFVYVAPSLALLLVAVGGLTLVRARSDPPRSSLRRWTIAALVVAALCWSGPILDQVLGWSGSNRGYGNLINLYDAARAHGQTVGVRAGAYAVVRTVGVPPWWLRAPQPPVSRTFEIFARPAVGSLISAAAVLAGLAVALALAARRRRGDVVGACASALALCAALGLVTATFPNEQVFAYSYASWWASPTGMWVWLALGWSAATLLAHHVPRAVAPRPNLAMALGLSAVLTASIVVAVSQGPDSKRDLYRPARSVVEAVDARLGHPRSVRVDGSNLDLGSPAVYALRRRGAKVGIDFGKQFGKAYRLDGRRYDQILDIEQGSQLPPGARLLTRIEIADPKQQTFTVSVRRNAVAP